MKFKCKFLYLLINYKNSNSVVSCPVKTLLTRSAPCWGPGLRGGTGTLSAGGRGRRKGKLESGSENRKRDAQSGPSSSAAGLWHTPRGLRSGICMRAAHADPEPAGRGPRGGREATLFGRRRLEAGDSAAITEPAARELLPFHHTKGRKPHKERCPV